MIIESFDSALGGQPLEARLRDEVALYPGMTVNWGFLNWQNGERFDEGGNDQIPSASTRKVSILMGALAATGTGAFDLNDRFVTEKRVYEVDSGIFHRLQPGIELAYEDALKAMIMLSDNASTIAVMERFGGTDYFNAYCARIGLRQTVHTQGLPEMKASSDVTNLTSVTDTLKLLSWIERGRTDIEVANMLECDTAHCSFATNILKANKLNDRLPALLPRNVKVAHKTGTMPVPNQEIIVDAGTVYAPGDEDKPLFTLAVFARDIPTELQNGTPGKAGAAILMSRMARVCYDAALAV